ncbi:REST corepressor 1 isoform X2 [Teleopsis dalmanni]|uniref:REST corepressor 1 isoform X2 n=1 Tax=Teleopsis dalmanni TaxID=139649 RepID=UPI0018CEFF83|nr:REST corepressor 1 isoform X2 [Teleopsis dalmanni]
MVLAERNAELVRNGRRSRGPSPNGHSASAGNSNGAVVGGGGAGTPETSSDDDNFKRNGKSKTKAIEYEEKIRVGRDYQAVCPALIPEGDRKPEILNDRALLVWSPTKEIPDLKLEEYISVAKEKYGYNGEQALGMLFWHKHDLERAVMDLANFTPFPDEWTVEDKVLFEQAFQFHGKSFHRIRQMLPDKSIASLVKYYYSWKKTRHRQSVMDRTEKVKSNKEGSENGSENGSNEESDSEDKVYGSNGQAKANSSGSVISEILSKSKKPSDLTANENDNESGGRNTPSSNSGVGGFCSNCGVICNVLCVSPLGKMCSSCHHHWRRTGNKRPTSGPTFGKRVRDPTADRHERKPPKGIYINHDDIITLASPNGARDFFKGIERKIISLHTQVQLNKQTISSLKRKTTENVEDLRPAEVANRINSRWSNEEINLAVQGIRKYGKDFQLIAETLGTKTESHVRTFYINYRRRYNLDQVLKKHEAEKDGSNMDTANTNKKSEKKENSGVNEESDNTTSSETTISKSTTDEAKSSSSIKLKENIIMEIDLDDEPSEVTPPASKKIGLNVGNLDVPKPTTV